MQAIVVQNKFVPKGQFGAVVRVQGKGIFPVLRDGKLSFEDQPEVVLPRRNRAIDHSFLQRT